MLEAEQIREMSMAEHLQALEQLWDAVCPDDANAPSPGWHATVLQERQERAASGESRFLTLDQVKARLRPSEP
ncbi:MAG: addiction module protein [Planctomycetes bacterium]|nr:addiction module protein [Planctomycetota bacterium]